MSSAASAVPFEECPAATREVSVLALACSTLGTVLPPQAVRATTATAVSVETGISLCIATSLRSAPADAGGARVPRAEPLLQDAVDETCGGGSDRWDSALSASRRRRRRPPRRRRLRRALGVCAPESTAVERRRRRVCSSRSPP